MVHSFSVEHFLAKLERSHFLDQLGRYFQLCMSCRAQICWMWRWGSVTRKRLWSERGKVQQPDPTWCSHPAWWWWCSASHLEYVGAQWVKLNCLRRSLSCFSQRCQDSPDVYVFWGSSDDQLRTPRGSVSEEQREVLRGWLQLSLCNYNVLNRCPEPESYRPSEAMYKAVECRPKQDGAHST